MLSSMWISRPTRHNAPEIRRANERPSPFLPAENLPFLAKHRDNPERKLTGLPE
jgi:hypothetical protein